MKLNVNEKINYQVVFYPFDRFDKAEYFSRQGMLITCSVNLKYSVVLKAYLHDITLGCFAMSKTTIYVKSTRLGYTTMV